MNLLAIETSTEACSVALMCGDAQHERFEIAPRRHAELVLPWIDALLAEAGIGKRQLDAIAVSKGPGAFTGVRLGISIASGIAFALDRPLLPISTLAALAEDAAAVGFARVVAALDARMGEVYLGRFERQADTNLLLVGEECVGAPATAERLVGEDWCALGTGFAATEGALLHRLAPAIKHSDASALPRASGVARLAARALLRGESVAPEAIEPAYLRNKVAQTMAERGVM